MTILDGAKILEVTSQHKVSNGVERVMDGVTLDLAGELCGFCPVSCCFVVLIVLFGLTGGLGCDGTGASGGAAAATAAAGAGGRFTAVSWSCSRVGAGATAVIVDTMKASSFKMVSGRSRPPRLRLAQFAATMNGCIQFEIGNLYSLANSVSIMSR